MTRILYILALLVTPAATLSQATLAEPTAVQSSKSIAWMAIESYIVSHAKKIDANALAALKDETFRGTQTWTLTGSSPVAMRPDGPGIGWPAINTVITFSTSAEAVTAAVMIEAAIVQPSAP